MELTVVLSASQRAFAHLLPRSQLVLSSYGLKYFNWCDQKGLQMVFVMESVLFDFVRDSSQNLSPTFPGAPLKFAGGIFGLHGALDASASARLVILIAWYDTRISSLRRSRSWRLRSQLGG
eukprot:6082465-Amphidinium_carterae.1